MTIDPEKIRREAVRWNLIQGLNNSRPIGLYAEVLLSIIQALYPDATQREVMREMGYLQSRDLINIKKQPDSRWHGELTRYGTDIAEYTIDCEPGIARPAKYW